MNRENMLTWIEALESGEYPQTQRVLHDGKGFCCLGVLCDINNVEWKRDSLGNFFYLDTKEHGGLPGPTIMSWLDIDLQELRIPVSSLTHEQWQRLGLLGESPRASVANMNDQGFSFAEIAAILRKEFIK